MNNIKPSHGAITFSKVIGNDKNLFGTNITPNHFIQLKINNCEVNNEYGTNHYFPRNNLITVNLTPVQFSNLIVNMNTSVGSPCTITRFNGEPVEQDSTQSKLIEKTENLFKDKFQDKLNSLDSTIKIINNTKMTKKVKEELLSNVQQLKIEVEQNIPFYAKVFKEEMEKIVLDAKTEISAEMKNTQIETIKVKELL